ncbi:MAG: nucleoside-diphosphate kinase [Prevotellaceae bacterium]|jgi:nucleoside-diphosphate kinase|nr:nucleoside-diphosphate kinase [Prevotellaceae bacterium]
MLEKTLIIIKPSGVQREIVGEVISRFERKGLRLAGLKMVNLTDKILNEHYAHLADKPFFPRIKQSMTVSPVVIICLEGVEAVSVVRAMTGVTNGRNAAAGTVRGDFSMSNQENIIHASDSVENGKIEVKRFFADTEIFDYQKVNLSFINNLEEINF